MNNEIKKVEQAPISIGQFLKTKESQIKMALPKHIDSNKILRVAMTEITANPMLRQCTMESLIGSLIRSAQLGLLPDSVTGEAYLIPYKNNKKGGIYECQFQVGYKGLIKLAYNSGMVEDVDAHEVCENDLFEFEYGSKAHLKHIPNMKSRGEVTCYYGIVKLKGSEFLKFIVMSKEDIEKHKAYSRSASYSSSPWVTNYDEMAKKTAIRAVLKYVHKTADDLTRAVAIDEQADIGIQDNSMIFTDVDVVNEKPATKTEKLIEAVKQQETKEPPVISALKQFEQILLACKTKDELSEVANDITLAKQEGKITAADADLLRVIYNGCEKKL